MPLILRFVYASWNQQLKKTDQPEKPKISPEFRFSET